MFKRRVVPAVGDVGSRATKRPEQILVATA